MAISNSFKKFKWLCVLILLLTLTPEASSAAQTYNLMGYRGPSAVGTTWLYSGLDWDGRPSDTRMEIISSQKTITCYTNGVTATPYSVDVIDIRNDYGNANPDHSFTSTDEWHDYITVSDGFRMWGSDDDEESLRGDGGLTYGTTLAIGQTTYDYVPIYESGTYIGVFNQSVTLLDVSDVTVPAGTFRNCLHLRFSMTGAAIQTRDEWWALDVGVVKLQGVSGDGSGQLRLLERYNFTVDPPVEPKLSQPSPGITLLLLKGNNKVMADDVDKDGYSVAQGDCNDSDATIHPGATEVCGDDIDQDCSGSDIACGI